MESGITTMATVSPSQKRLQKELMSLIREPPPGVRVDGDLAGKNLTQWIVHLEGAKGTLFEGERFQLQFKFSSKYPFESPEVTFIGGNIPVHPHVYSNGHICLSILTDDWSPALSVQSVCLSIVSMLSSCTEKKRPMDNAFYVRTCNKNPKKTKWWYHGMSWTYEKMTVCNSNCQSSLMICHCTDIAGPSGMTFCVSWIHCPYFIDKIAGETSPYY